MSLLVNSTTAKTRWDFDPHTIPDCDIWFDAADTSTLTLDGTTVKAWRNKGSINMNAIQDTGTCTSGSTINGLNYITCPASTQLAFTCAITAQSRSWFYVARCTTQFNVSTAPQYWAPVGQTVGNGQDSLGWSRVNTTAYQCGSGPSGIAAALVSPLLPNPTNTLHLFSMVYNNVTVAGNTMSVNGISYGLSTNAALSSYATGSIKYSINYVPYNTGSDICEIIHYNRNVTIIEQRAIEGYLMWKWGLKRQNEVGFVPTSISNCELWYDADVNYTDETSRATNFTFSAGDSVQSWKDKSGFGRDATFYNVSPSTVRPVLTANQVSGKTAVIFNGANILNTPLSLPTTSPITVFVVAASTVFGSYRAPVSFNANPGTRGSMLTIYQSSSNFWWISSGTSGTDGTTGSIGLVSGRYDIVAGYWNTTLRSQINVNGHHIPSSTSAATSFRANSTTFIGGTTANVANSTTPADLWAGGIAEIILYTATLTVDQRNQVERYLSLKWNRPLVNACALGHPSKRVPMFNRTFSPTEIIGCSLWLDAADSATLTVDEFGSVSQWNDKSGNGFNALQATPANQPKASGGGVTFGGVSHFLQITNPAIRRAQLFVVARATAANGVLLQKGFAAGTDLEFSLNTTTSDVRATYNLTTGTTGTATFFGGVDLTTITLYEATWIGTTITILINGTQQATSGLSGTQRTASTGATDLRIGADFSSSSNTSTSTTRWTGTIYEIVCFNTELSVAERQRLEGYLATKWGIEQRLPKSAPAFNGTAITTPASFTPTQVSDLRAWYDASDTGSFVVASALVTEWRDKSGNGLHLTARSTFGTARVAAAFQNGLSVLNCNGNTIYAAPAGSAVYPLDVYVVIALKSPLTRCDVFSITAPSPTDNFNSLTFSEHTTSRWHNGSSSFARTPLTVLPTAETSNDFLLINWSLANNNFIIRRNGIQPLAPINYTFTLTANSVFQLGYRQFGNPPDVNLNAYIGEIIVYSRQLGLTERRNVETYLATKWDIRSTLPPSHIGYYVQPNRAIESFIPTSISGCRLWLDASDRTSINGGASISAGGTVTSWADKSGNGVSLTVGGTPTWNYSLNQLPGITTTAGRFTGLLTGSLLDFTNTTFIVTQYNTNPTAGYPCVVIGNLETASTRWLRCLDWATTLRASAFFTANAHATVTAPAALTPFLWTSFYTGDTAIFARLNAAATTGSAIPANPGSFAAFVNIGCETLTTLGTTNTWPGVISEIIIYNSVLSATNVSIVESYLARKWGLSQNALLANRYINPGSIPNSPRIFPTTFLDIALWLDAADPDADGILPASGTALPFWADKSGSSRSCAQTVASQRPTFTFDGIYPAIQFAAGSSQFLRQTSPVGLLTSTNYGIFVVARGTDASIATQTTFCVSKVTNTNFVVMQVPNNINNFNQAVYSSVGKTQTQFSSATTNTSLITISDNSALNNTNIFFYNGSPLGTTFNASTTANVATDANGYYVGVSNVNNNTIFTGYLTGYIYEIIVMLHQPTAQERQYIESYLAWKWGIQSSLPASNPYSKFSP